LQEDDGDVLVSVCL